MPSPIVTAAACALLVAWIAACAVWLALTAPARVRPRRRSGRHVHGKQAA